MRIWILNRISWIAEKIAIQLLEIQWHLVKRETNNETRKQMAKETIAAMECFNRDFITKKGEKISEEI